MRLTYYVSVAFILLSLSSCKNLSNTTNSLTASEHPDVESYSLLGILWQQNAAEYRALCYQAFNTAKLQLDTALKENATSNKPLAIITDIDETILDNSPYQAARGKAGKPYTSESWKKWENLEKAASVPGAIDFLNYANTQNVTVFYISNRKEANQKSTFRNLQKVDAPNADTTHIFLKQTGVDKEVRRQKVLANYDVVLYLGDNLSDFSEIFDDQTTEKRNKLSDSLQKEFGNTFIVLPNPMYGAWQTDGIYESNYNWSPAQKDSIIRSKLNGY